MVLVRTPFLPYLARAAMRARFWSGAHTVPIKPTPRTDTHHSLKGSFISVCRYGVMTFRLNSKTDNFSLTVTSNRIESSLFG